MAKEITLAASRREGAGSSAAAALRRKSPRDGVTDALAGPSDECQTPGKVEEIIGHREVLPLVAISLGCRTEIHENRGATSDGLPSVRQALRQDAVPADGQEWAEAARHFARSMA